MANTVPEQITTPIGVHKALLLIIIGTTPTAVVADVRKIGKNGRRKCASEYRLLSGRDRDIERFAECPVFTTTE